MYERLFSNKTILSTSSIVRFFKLVLFSFVWRNRSALGSVMMMLKSHSSLSCSIKFIIFIFFDELILKSSYEQSAKPLADIIAVSIAVHNDVLINFIFHSYLLLNLRFLLLLAMERNNCFLPFVKSTVLGFTFSSLYP